MKSKRIVFLIFCITLLFLVGCRPSSPLPGENDAPPKPDEPVIVNEITVIADGATDYRITISDFASETVRDQAVKLRDGIQAVTGVKLGIKTDWQDKDNSADIKEILIGKTDRAQSVALYKELNANQYVITVSENKVVILGATDELLAIAVTDFLSNYVGYVSENEFELSTKLCLADGLKVFGDNDKSGSVVLYIANDELSYVDALYRELNGKVESLTLKTFNDGTASVFDYTKFGTVIVVGAESLPCNNAQVIDRFLNNRGRILFLGGPAFSDDMYEWDGELISLEEYKQTMLEQVDEQNSQIILDAGDRATLNILSPASNNESGSNVSMGNYGLSGSTRQLFHEVKNLSEWSILAARVQVDLDKANMVSFHARPGDDHTESFSFEVEESDGTRWYVAVPFTNDDWTHYTYHANEFTWFTGNKSKQGGVPDFSDVVRIRIGFAMSHHSTSPGHHSYYMSDVTFYQSDADITFNALSLDGVSPLYEQYPITNAASVSADKTQSFITDRDYVIPENLISRHPGISGIGYGKDTNIRFVPLLTVKNSEGLVSGHAAWMDIYATQTGANGEREGAIVGYFGACSEDFYNDDGIAAIVETVCAMTGSTFIVDGGTTEYTYLANDTDSVLAGVKYVNLGAVEDQNVIATVSLYRDDRLLSQYSSSDITAIPLTNSIKAIQGEFDLSKGAPNRVVATLEKDGRTLDRVEHPIYYWEPKPENDRSYVYIEDGHFKQDGEILNLFGVNFSPAYQAARPEKDAYWNLSSTYQSYVTDGGYDPSVVLNDLKRIKGLGMNAVAIWFNVEHIESCNNVLDLLRMCEELGLYVDVSLRSVAYPLKNYDEEAVELVIQRLHLNENDNIVAYDIAWEPRIGNYDGSWAPNHKNGPGYFIGRQWWDDDFTAWTITQYGSIKNAEAAWGVSLGRTENGCLLLTDAILDDTSGKYQKAVAAYYRFLDDTVNTAMQQNVAHIRSLVPDQLVSFRMSMSGSACRTSSFTPSTHCFDFQSLAASVDFMQPEGYQLAANEDRALQIMFANAYARYVNPDAPVVWKEYGRSVWSKQDAGNFNPSDEFLELAADYYRYALEYCYQSDTAGMFCWYSTAGYRTDEDSDYGIWNPDGSDRPVTALLREYAPKFINQNKHNETVYITIERDDYTGGLFGMYDAVKGELAKAYAAGKSVTFIDASQGKDGSYAYADTLLDEYVADAVTSSGTAPLRYVNGIFKNVSLYQKDGKQFADITVCNTKQSIWRAGTVSIVGANSSLRYTIQDDVDYLEDVTVTIELTGRQITELRLYLNGIAFGPSYEITFD